MDTLANDFFLNDTRLCVLRAGSTLRSITKVDALNLLDADVRGLEDDAQSLRYIVQGTPDWEAEIDLWHARVLATRTAANWLLNACCPSARARFVLPRIERIADAVTTAVQGVFDDLRADDPLCGHVLEIGTATVAWRDRLRARCE